MQEVCVGRAINLTGTYEFSRSDVFKYYVKGSFQFLTPAIATIYFLTAGIDIALLITSIIFSYVIFHIATINNHFINAHRAITIKSKPLRFLLNWISTVIVVTPPASWSMYHYFHHRYVDSDLDPHSPNHIGFKAAIFFAHKLDTYEEISEYQQTKAIAATRHLLRDNAAMFYEKYFFAVLFVHCAILFSLGMEYFVYFYVLPHIYHMLCEVHAILNHSGKIGGHQPANSKEHLARNHAWFWPMLGVESLHADHHNGKDSQNKVLKFLKKFDK